MDIEIGYHHRAARGFFAKHPDKAERIGQDKIEAALAEHVAVKLESLYWRRRLDDFNDLLAYARKEGLQNPQILEWERRSKVPDWMIRLKDRLSMGRK